MEEAFQSGVQGDLLEAGVWRGGQTVLMKAVLEAFGDETRSVWLLDSFNGIPKPRNPSDASDDETLTVRVPFKAFLMLSRCCPSSGNQVNIKRL